MERFWMFACIFSLFFSGGLCGEVTILQSPGSVRFGTALGLHTSQLSNVFTATLGFSPKFQDSAAWDGLVIANPTKSASAAVFVAINGGGAAIRLEGPSYSLSEDTSVDNFYNSLVSTVAERSTRMPFFRRFKYEEADKMPITLESKVFNTSLDADAKFLREVALLPYFLRRVEDEREEAVGGKDVIFLSIDSLADVARYYGINSLQVKDAGALIREALNEVESLAEGLYGERVLVATILTEGIKTLNRAKRDLFGPDVRRTEETLNVGTEYTEDYPIVFNIVFWLFLLLVIALIAISHAMATMDPGRDSIIYRMTNPRIKKDG